MAKFEVTVDNERLLARLKELGKVPDNLEFLTGANVFETVDEDEKPGLSVILGPLNGGRRGRKPKAIPIALDPARRPEIKGNGRLYRADVAPVGDGFELVRQEKDDVGLRIITTGLLPSRNGSTTEDFANIAASGRKLRYHGVFPITYDAAEIVGESIDTNVTGAQSRVIADERFGRINGLVGVPRQRVASIEGVVGGPVLVGQIDGTLKIHELTPTGWKVTDVTNDERWQKEFMELAERDVVYLAKAAASGKHREKQLKVIKGPPADHPDATYA